MRHQQKVVHSQYRFTPFAAAAVLVLSATALFVIEKPQTPQQAEYVQEAIALDEYFAYFIEDDTYEINDPLTQ